MIGEDFGDIERTAVVIHAQDSGSDDLGRGLRDGQQLQYGLELLRRLPRCLMPIAPMPMPRQDGWRLSAQGAGAVVGIVERGR